MTAVVAVVAGIGVAAVGPVLVTPALAAVLIVSALVLSMIIATIIIMISIMATCWWLHALTIQLAQHGTVTGTVLRRQQFAIARTPLDLVDVIEALTCCQSNHCDPVRRSCLAMKQTLCEEG